MSLFDFLKRPVDLPASSTESFDKQYYEVVGEFNHMRVCPEKHFYFRNRFCCPQCGSEEYREVVARDIKKYPRGCPAGYYESVRYDELVRKTDKSPVNDEEMLPDGQTVGNLLIARK